MYGNVFANGKDYGLELFAFLELDAYNTGLSVTPVQEVWKEQYLQEIEDTALAVSVQISLSTEDLSVVISRVRKISRTEGIILIGKLSKQTCKDTYKKIFEKEQSD